MEKKSSYNERGAFTLALFAIFITLLYWVTDAIIGSLVFNKGNLVKLLFRPESYALWISSAFIVIVILLAGYIINFVRNRNKIDNEYHFSRIAENAPDIVFRWSFKNELEYASPVLYEITGYTLEEIKAMRHRPLRTPPSDLRELFAEYKKAIEEGRPLSPREIPFLRKDGTLAHLEVHSVPIKNDSGKVVAFEGVVRDITGRKKLNLELEKASAEWRRTFDTISEIIMIVDRRGIITRVNEAAAKLFGLPYNDILGKECFRLVHQTSSRHLFCPHAQALADGRSHTLEIYEPHFGKEFSITATPMRDDDGNLIGSVHIMRDITVQKRMEKEMLKTQKLESIGVLAGGIAHDFNNILTVILANISIAKKEAKEGSDLLDTLSEIEGASTQAKNLTRQLLTFSKGGAPVKKTVHIGNLLEESVRFALRGSNVKSEFFVPDDLWLIQADEGQMAQVINNLVINAAQAMPQGGTINVRAENISCDQVLPPGANLKPGPYVKISVQDFGQGIAEDNIHKVFDPYFTTKPRGSGLGLATTYSIIKNHGGYIDFESKLGEETTFYIYIPASPEEFLADEIQKEMIPDGRGKILVMDDEKKIRDALNRILNRIGYEVELAEDGAQAIELYKAALKSGKPFDVVIMDLTIPGGMGGQEAIEKLKQLDPQVKAIIASGYANNPVMSNYKKLGFLDVLTKPFRAEELNQVLQKVISSRSA